MYRNVFAAGLALLSIFSIPQANAQTGSAADIRIAWGADVTQQPDHSQTAFVGNQKQGFVQITDKGSVEIGLTPLYTDLKPGMCRKPTMPSASKFIMPEGAVQIDDRAYMLFSDYDSKSKSEKFIIREIDLQEAEFKGEPKEIISTQGKLVGTRTHVSGFLFKVMNKFTVVAPEGSDRILVYYRRMSDNVNEFLTQYEMVYHVFDRNWNPLWMREATFNYMGTRQDGMIPQELNTRATHMLVGNDVFTFIHGADSLSKGQNAVSVYHITQKAPVRKYRFSPEGVSLSNVAITPMPNGNLLLAAHTQSGALPGSGYATAVFNVKDPALEDVAVHPFKDSDGGLPNLTPLKLLPRPGGGWYMVGEQYRYEMEVVQNSNGSAMVYHFYFDDMVVTGLDANGERDFSLKIPRRQHLRDVYWRQFGGSVSAFEYGGDLYLFHLDNPQNKGVESADRAGFDGSAKATTLMCVKITPDGKMARFSLFDVDPRTPKKIIVPASLRQLEPGVLVNAGERTGYYSRTMNNPAFIYLK